MAFFATLLTRDSANPWKITLFFSTIRVKTGANTREIPRNCRAAFRRTEKYPLFSLIYLPHPLGRPL
jgi:hypothetical protein